MTMQTLYTTQAYGLWMLTTTLFFTAIYVLFASFFWWMAHKLNRPISLKPLHNGQIKQEIRQSLRSILLFGLGIFLPLWLINAGLASVNMQATWRQIAQDCILIIVWNDLHFYAIHRMLHRYFKHLHGVHHQSVTSTPFAAYSMSSSEAVLLGSVMPLAMLVYTFSLQALIVLPIWSICINALSHSNCDLFPKSNPFSLFGFIKHHQHHHSHYRGNYSFFFGQLDVWLGTAQTSKPALFKEKLHDTV